MKRCKDCVKEAREERAQRRANGEMVPTVSDELRQQRSERARKMHAEGRFGGSEFGRRGGLARHRINDSVLAYFRDRQDLVNQAIERALRSKGHGYRLRAAEMLIKLDQEEEKIRQSARGAGKAPDEMTQAELEEFVTQALLSQIESGEIDVSNTTIEGLARDVEEASVE